MAEYDERCQAKHHEMSDIYFGDENVIEGKCIICFNTESMKIEVLEKIKNGCEPLQIKNQEVTISNAREPTDVLWLN